MNWVIPHLGIINCKLSDYFQYGTPRQRIDQHSTAWYYWRTWWHALFSLRNNFWPRMHLGQDRRGDASWGKWNNQFLPHQPTADNAGKNAPGSMIPPLLPLYFCH